MGNSLGGRSKNVKVMKIDGEILKKKTPISVGEVIKDYPGHVLIESESVKRYGIRAKPLESQQELNPKKIYFLLELPKFPKDEEEKEGRGFQPRRVRSGIHMNAKDRLEHLMLSRRSMSDLTVLNRNDVVIDETTTATTGRSTIRMRLPKSQVVKLVEESKDSTEAAERIMDLFMGAAATVDNNNKEGNKGKGVMVNDVEMNQWKPVLGSIRETFKNREKRRVGFLPLKEDYQRESLEIVHQDCVTYR